MRGWIRLLIMVRGKLMGLYERVNKSITRAACNIKSTASEALCEVLELNEQRRRIVNLAVLFRVLKSELSDEEFETIKTNGECLLGVVHERTRLRKIDRAFVKAERIIHKLGFDETKLAKEYPGYIKGAERLNEIGDVI